MNPELKRRESPVSCPICRDPTGASWTARHSPGVLGELTPLSDFMGRETAAQRADVSSPLHWRSAARGSPHSILPTQGDACTLWDVSPPSHWGPSITTVSAPSLGKAPTPYTGLAFIYSKSGKSRVLTHHKNVIFNSMKQTPGGRVPGIQNHAPGPGLLCRDISCWARGSDLLPTHPPWAPVKCRVGPLPPTPGPCCRDSDWVGPGSLDVTEGSEEF